MCFVYEDSTLEPEQFTTLCESQNYSASFLQVVLIPFWDSFLPCFWRSVLSQRPKGTHLQSTCLCSCLPFSNMLYKFYPLCCPQIWTLLNSARLLGFLDFTSIFCCLESPGNKLGLWLCFPSQRVACTSCCPVSENLCLCIYMYTYIHIYIHTYIYIYSCFCHGQK